MDIDDNGANDFTIEELEELFSDVNQSETPPATDDANTQASDNEEDTKNVETNTQNASKEDVDNTKAFANRLKKSTEKARLEERNAIATSLGYDSYDDMIKKQETKKMEDNGLDPEKVAPIVDELVKKRLDNDPRMLELKELRKRQITEFGKKELEEISKLTNGKITKISQLSSNVIELWKTKGSLKSAYIEIEGEKLINSIRSEHSKGNTNHLQSPNGTLPSNEKARPLNKAERDAWRVFNPGITEEELNKKLTIY